MWMYSWCKGSDGIESVCKGSVSQCVDVFLV